MKRLTIFAHHGIDDDVAEYIFYHLRHLRLHSHKLVLVSNSPISDHAMSRLYSICDCVRIRPNTGFDFAAWRDALKSEDMTDWDEVLLTNSSIIGPLFDLSPMFHEMQARACDFWGLTVNRGIRNHLQSYFLCFRRKVITSEAWPAFWCSVRDETTKRRVILRYETTLTKHFRKNGFVADAYMPPIVKRGRERIGYHWTNTWVSIYIPHDNNRMNPTIYFPVELIQNGFPYLKTSLVWGIERRRAVPLNVIKQMKHVTYDWAHIGL